MGVTTMVVYGIGRHFLELPKEELQSGATIVLIALGLWVLYELGRPLDHVPPRCCSSPWCWPPSACSRSARSRTSSSWRSRRSDYLVVIAIAVAIGFVLINIALRLVNRYVPEGPRPYRNAPSDPAGAGARSSGRGRLAWARFVRARFVWGRAGGGRAAGCSDGGRASAKRFDLRGDVGRRLLEVSLALLEMSDEGVECPGHRRPAGDARGAWPVRWSWW